MSILTLFLGITLVITGSVLAFKARMLTWRGRKSILSSIKATFSDAVVKEELGKYLTATDARKATMLFRFGAVSLSIGIWFLVIWAYDF